MFNNVNDVALLLHIAHFLDEKEIKTLLKKIYERLPSKNGCILANGFLMRKNWPSPFGSFRSDDDSEPEPRQEFFLRGSK